jgi:hypothetical protein
MLLVTTELPLSKQEASLQSIELRFFKKEKDPEIRKRKKTQTLEKRQDFIEKQFELLSEARRSFQALQEERSKQEMAEQQKLFQKKIKEERKRQKAMLE